MTDYAIIYTLAGTTFLFTLALAYRELLMTKKSRSKKAE